MVKTSVCSRRKSVTFYWRSCVSGRHIDETVDALMAAVQGPNRARTYVDFDNEAMFRTRLEMAERGRLRPDDHVKTISYDPSLEMFEIRWTDVCARLQDLASGLYGALVEGINVRLYYAELGHDWVVGLVVHEKAYGDTDDETRRLQNEHIQRAVTLCRADSKQWWGVPELLKRHGAPGPDLTSDIT